ncbi:MAG: precorrin-6y C5,15-methyltransferase (decarboxylating) subunit CbiE [Nitrospiraceae bacterium]
MGIPSRQPVLIIGIPANGPLGLPARLIERIESADLLCGGARHLALFPNAGIERWTIGDNVPQLVERLRQERSRRVIVLASGDPLLFGIGATLADALGKDSLEIVPHVSAVQEAFARIALPWHDARIVSAHGRPLEPVIASVLSHPKVAMYTDATNTPGRIASALLAAGSPNRRAVVAQRLGESHERVEDLTLRAVQDRVFDPLNVMLVLEPLSLALSAESMPQIDDGSLMQRHGQLTKQDVRAVSVARLGFWPGGVMWDIGAGSGAISIDMVRRNPLVRIFAMERDPEQQQCLRTNLARFGISSVTVVKGEAPVVLGALPHPHAIFIGGTGGKLTAILDRCWECLIPGGRVVANLVVLDHLSEWLSWCQRHSAQPDVLLVQLARGAPIVGSLRFEALNPVYVVMVCKGDGR